MLACAQLLTRLGVPTAVAWVIDGALLAAAGVAAMRIRAIARRQQPPVVAEAERILRAADQLEADPTGRG